ncbi:MAG: hypothetical protein AAF943_11530 [Pseudomonadota bacterium]
MSLDASTLPFSPFLIVITLLYALISATITGPTIIHRELEQSDWHATCQSNLNAEITATRRPDQVVPQVPDVGGMLCGMFPELGDLCMMIPDPNAMARETERRACAIEAQRLARAASGTEGTCACAAQLFTETERLSVALYAASGRAFTPSAIANRDVGLSRALNAPQCKMEG